MDAKPKSQRRKTRRVSEDMNGCTVRTTLVKRVFISQNVMNYSQFFENVLNDFIIPVTRPNNLKFKYTSLLFGIWSYFVFFCFFRYLFTAKKYQKNYNISTYAKSTNMKNV